MAHAKVVHQPYDKITRIYADETEVVYHGDGDADGFAASFKSDVVDAHGNIVAEKNKIIRFHHTRRLTECSKLLIINVD